jgi:hypothetical protein
MGAEARISFDVRPLLLAEFNKNLKLFLYSKYTVYNAKITLNKRH